MPLPVTKRSLSGLKLTRAFTLLELTLVLAILAILATIAVTSLSGVEDQTRFDVTQRQLTNIQSAIDGDPGLKQPDGSNIPNGFVNDVGRLPQLIGADPKTQLQELWTQPTAMALYSIKSPPAPDADIQLGAGWRGPYLKLQIGQTQLVDGWGNGYSINPSADTAATPLVSLQSLGSDNAAGSTTSDIYAADLPATPLLFPTVQYQTTVSCSVPWGDPSPVSAKLFQPDGTSGLVTSVPGVITAASGSGALTSVSFSGVFPGNRAIRFYSDAGITPIATQYLNVPRGGLANVVIATTQPSTTTATTTNTTTPAASPGN